MARLTNDATKGSRFVAIDGESFTDDEHRYVLLLASTGESVFDAKGIATKDCLRYLLALREAHPKSLFVAFGLNYDVNMMLRDLGRERLKELWTEQRTWWHGYHIEWIPGKWFRVAKKKQSIKIYETFGFFQTSFVKTLMAWGFDTQDVDAIEEMKASRSVFTEELHDEIISYCAQECALLVALMDKLATALSDIDLKLTAWNGAGCIASALLTKNGIKRYSGMELEWSSDVHDYILRGYFGGRTELFLQGTFPRLIEYDIRSAYPFEATRLPSLQGRWRYTREYEPGARWALWRVSWELADCHIAPFPHREKQEITWPTNGEGVYHASEVAAALTRYPEIQVRDGWVFTPSDPERPFEFVGDVYRQRSRLKEQGHAGEKCLKLGINALYGKLAQGVGFRGKPPVFRSYFWAGAITAGVRARMFTLANAAPDALAMVATDGIFFASDPGFATGNGLGELERLVITDAFTAQPGVYQGWIEGDEIRRSRGFFAREIDFEDLREGFERHGPNYVGTYPSRRFVGLGSALTRREMTLWRTWHESTRKLSLVPSHKFASEHLEDGNGRMFSRHTPPALDKPPPVSSRYVPKAAGYLDADADFLQGTDQPLKT